MPPYQDEIDVQRIVNKGFSWGQQWTTRWRNVRIQLRQNKWIVAVLLLVGIGLGIYADLTQKVYQQRIIVTPNFGSVDYLYQQVALLQAKIREKDWAYVKKIGIRNPDQLLSAEIEPVVDIYSFINSSKNGTNYAQNPPSFELLKLFAESGDIKKVVKDEVTSKNYPYHQIVLTTLGRCETPQLMKPFLDFINLSPYFNTVKKVHVSNIQHKMAANDTMIKQIDRLLTAFSQSGNRVSGEGKMVLFSENSQLNDIIKSKDELIKEKAGMEMEMLNYDQVVKEVNVCANELNTKGINGKLKLVLPILLCFVYLGYLWFFKQPQSE